MPRTTATCFVVFSACGIALGCAKDTPVAPSAAAPATIASASAVASRGDEGRKDDGNGKAAYSIALIGDTPYGPAKLAEFPALVAKINADPKVELVAHIGDIKAGKNAPCTDDYFATVRGLFDGFADPLVYTPGDNEWTDCHVATKNNGLYTPTERLAKVRSLFFPVAGRTLGVRPMHVLSQAHDRANAAYVENVTWTHERVVFTTLNITGSNNDVVSWGTPLPADAARYPSQAEEQSTRARANRTWLARTFVEAKRVHAPAVVLLFQADMWDTAEPSLSGYDALVRQIGTLSASFGKPVLLIEGDSHVFRVDNPFSADSPLHALHPDTPVANNVTRLVLEGSDAGRTEYVRLTIDAKAKGGVFAWERVPLQ